MNALGLSGEIRTMVEVDWSANAATKAWRNKTEGEGYDDTFFLE